MLPTDHLHDSHESIYESRECISESCSVKYSTSDRIHSRLKSKSTDNVLNCNRVDTLFSKREGKNREKNKFSTVKSITHPITAKLQKAFSYSTLSFASKSRKSILVDNIFSDSSDKPSDTKPLRRLESAETPTFSKSWKICDYIKMRKPVKLEDIYCTLNGRRLKKSRDDAMMTFGDVSAMTLVTCRNCGELVESDKIVFYGFDFHFSCFQETIR